MQVERGAGPFTAAFTLMWFFSLVVWGVDVVVRCPEEPIHALAPLFFILVFTLPAALLLGLFWRVVLGRSNPYDLLGEAVSRRWNYLVEPDPQAGLLLVGRMVALALYWMGVAAISYKAIGWIATDIVRVNYQAILSLAAVLASLVLLLPVRLFIQRLFQLAAASPKAETRLVGRLVSRPLVPFVAAAIGATAGAVVLMWNLRSGIAAAPWQTPALLLGAALVALFLSALICVLARHRLLSIIAAALLLAMVVASAISAATLDTGDSTARRHFLKMRTTGLAYQVISRLLDRDGDGFMHAFAGGDCEPFNPNVYPTAIDIPGNGVDEDCNGQDVTLVALDAGCWDFPVPPSFPKARVPVFLLTVDALSASHVSGFGYHRQTTPNLDNLMEECVTFTKAFSQGPSTRLSLAAAFISQYDSQIVRGRGTKVPWPLDDSNTTMAEHLAANGYQTVAVVPNTYFSHRWKGILQGFDTVDRSARASSKQHNAEQVTEAALKHVRRRHSRPLFLWTHYYDPHAPFNQPEGVKIWGKEKVDRYDAEIRYVDKHLHDLVKEIRATYRKDGYLLIITADHGSAFDENHNRHTHGFDLHSGVLNVPMLVCSPAIKPRWIDDTVVSLLDLPPTLVNLLDLRVKDASFEGTSLVPLLLHGASWPERVIFHQFFLIERTAKNRDPLAAAAVRTASFNFIWERENDEYELFNYIEDPVELDNRLSQHPELAASLDSMLKSWLFRVHRRYNPAARSHDGDGLGDSPYDGGYDDYNDPF